MSLCPSTLTRTAVGLIGVIVLAAGAARADCTGQTLFSCTIGKKVLQVCLSDGAAGYSYGKPGKPDLTLTAPLATLAYTPWSGVGISMTDTVRFDNGAVGYEVWASIDKMMEENGPEPQWQGGVNVMKGDDIAAELTCDRFANPPDLGALFDAKEGAGLCWDFANQAWQKTCSN